MMVGNRNWTPVRLGECFRVKHGFAFKGEHFADAGPYVVMTPGNFYDGGGFKYKAHEKYYTGDVPGGYILRKGDILIAMTEQTAGLLGSCAVIPTDHMYLHNQRLGLVVDLNEDSLSRRFLPYLFNMNVVRHQIQATATGAKVRHTSPSRIEDVTVLLPPIRLQRRIADILGTYDDLIENNIRRIAILDEMAQAIYRDWFVNFRFPDHEQVEIIESGLGPIPRGWKRATLGEVCRLTMGQSPKSEHYNEDAIGLPFHQGVTDFGPRFPTSRTYCTTPARVAEEGDVLFSVRAPVGRINIAPGKIVIGRGLSAIRRKDDRQDFLFYELRDLFKEEDTMGGGTIFKSVTKADMLEIQLLAPPACIVEQFEHVSRPVSAQIKNLTRRNTNLAQTRDLLLPKLISGEIDIETLDREPVEAIV